MEFVFLNPLWKSKMLCLGPQPLIKDQRAAPKQGTVTSHDASPISKKCVLQISMRCLSGIEDGNWRKFSFLSL